MRLSHSLSAIAILGAIFVSNVQAQDPATSDISEDTLQTSEKFSLGDLNPVHWGKDIEHDAEKLGNGIAKAAKKGWKSLEALAEPCNACKEAVGAGIDAFTCGLSAKAMMSQISECSAKVSEEEPVLSEDSPVLCSAIKAAVEIACKRVVKENRTLSDFRGKLIDHTCDAAHLCK